MKSTPRILIVEDDMIIAANISLQLTNLGYEVTGIVSRGEEAVLHAKSSMPDMILLDINLKGELDGIETARSIQMSADIPIIYLTANSDEATFEKAKKTRPKAFITKPFSKVSLQRAIALVAEQLCNNNGDASAIKTDFEVLGDRIFVRYKGKMEKLLFDDILYVEADRNYSTVVSVERHFVLTSTLKTLEEKLPGVDFLRVHRSFIVNISKLDAVADGHIEIGRKAIPIGKSYKEQLLRRIPMI